MIRVVALVTARGGSKTVPRKNLKLLGGKPLIGWSIEAARLSKHVARTILSTDDEEIAATGRAYGAEAPFLRPGELAQDTSSHISVAQHAIRWLREHGDDPDYILLLQPTSPFRTSEDIDAAVALADARRPVAVISVCEMERHPFLGKRIENGMLMDFLPWPASYPRRQDLGQAYALNGAIYLNRTASLMNDATFHPAGSLAYIMPPERSMDLDTPWDFHVAELIMKDLHERRRP
jgi:CMP-N-acetylneuraminic acid synthetase